MVNFEGRSFWGNDMVLGRNLKFEAVLFVWRGVLAVLGERGEVSGNCRADFDRQSSIGGIYGFGAKKAPNERQRGRSLLFWA